MVDSEAVWSLEDEQRIVSASAWRQYCGRRHIDDVVNRKPLGSVFGRRGATLTRLFSKARPFCRLPHCSVLIQVERNGPPGSCPSLVARRGGPAAGESAVRTERRRRAALNVSDSDSDSHWHPGRDRQIARSTSNDDRPRLILPAWARAGSTGTGGSAERHSGSPGLARTPTRRAAAAAAAAAPQTL